LPTTDHRPHARGVHGHLTVNNEKMSKSRGTGISPLRYLNLGMNPEWLRYYIAFKLNSKVEDLDFTGEDFVARVNSDLIGNTSTSQRAAPASSPRNSTASWPPACPTTRRRGSSAHW
jgi:methionyl-tRNA synthetase